MVVIKCIGHGIEVCRGSKENKHVEDLMRAPPDVELTREASLRPADLGYS